MRPRLLPFVILWTLILPGESASRDDDPPLPPPAKRRIDYKADVAPILERSCYQCHGPKKHQAGLSLHNRDKAMAGGDSGPIVEAGNSAESLLIEVTARVDPDYAMPPEGEGEPLTAAEVGVLRAWIDQGADWPVDAAAEPTGIKSDHWAFHPPKPPAPPAVENEGWIRNPIDRFVLARLEKEGIAPSPEADRRTLIRRLSLDLIGLPPSLDEVDAFLADDRPDAYERLVDRLLASPQYGEAWARHWLDRARYADTNGYEKDRERSIWPYRDWVIHSINADMPFDEFTIEQIAGDLLPDATPDQKTATGFHRNTMINEEGGIDVEEFRYIATVDRVATTGTVWLGLTIQCAQCHTHKFDPITQREYYQFFAFLNNADEPDVELPDPDIAARRAAIEAEIQKLEADLKNQYPPDGSESLATQVEAWEKTAKPGRWSILKPSKLVSRKHATLELQPDGSILASGDKPNNDIYEIDITTDLKAITALRLEVLTDPSLPEGGPGRAPLFQVGDFLLTEFEATAAPADGSADPVPLAFARATEDYAPKGRSAALAVDGAPDTGWSVQGQVGQPHQAVFELKEPLGDGSPLILRLALHQEFIHQMTMGRFRLWATTDAAPASASGVPTDVEAVLLIPPDERTDEQAQRVVQYYLSIAPERAQKREPIAALRKATPRYPTTMVMEERAAEHARATHIHKRGEFLSVGEEVQPGVPAVLHPIPPGAPANRLTLARWLVDERNPLVGRVIMNQLWQTYFGRGLVTTTEDFGLQGEPPSHPELLDWLATEFPRRGWSMKAMHRAIVTSATYRQSSRATPAQIAADPKNVLLGRGPRFRVDAETIRDIALSAAGLLAQPIGGPSVRPPQPEGATSLAYGQAAWVADKGASRYRRGLYTFLKRTSPYAAFTTMDAPGSETTCVRRERSNTPLQALTMLNDDVFIEAAGALARRLIREAPEPSEDARLNLAYRLCLGREPRPEERARVLAFYNEQLARFRDGQLDASPIVAPNPDPPTPLLAVPSDADPNELAAWTIVARVLLNLDETVTKE